MAATIDLASKQGWETIEAELPEDFEKRWKSLCHFDRLPNYRDDTILSWLYAKLLLALLMHRMVSGASALFPPETPADTTLALDTVAGDQHRMARNRRRTLAA